MKIGQRYIRKMLAAGILPALLLTGCMGDEGDCGQTDRLDGKSYLTLAFVAPNDGTATRTADSATRAAAEDPDGYEEGTDYENKVNISGGDYKIYFFTYEEGDTNGGTLIAEFKPDEVTSSSTSSVTTYTVTGSVPAGLRKVSSFRVVMLANWGNYPSVTEGETTIDNLCEGTNTTFNASKKFVIDADNLIPFYGVQEYTGVTFATGATTPLGTPISLLRAVAKVEVILTEESDVDAFDDVSIVNYNSQGYCAPWQIYVADDYNTDYGIQPEDEEWSGVFVDGLHLVSKDSNGNGINDTDNGDTSNPKTQAFTQITDASQDTWRIYLPEYNNMGEDYSYISVTIDGKPYEIYFAEYLNGITDNTAPSNRYNIKRNNLYRFYVTTSVEEQFYKITIRVWVEKWEELFDSEYVFGET